MKLNDTYLKLISENKLTPDTISLIELDYDPEKDYDNLKKLANSLTTNTSVLFVDLTDCQLKDEQLSEILDLLKRNTSINKVSFAHNQLTDKSAPLIAKFITDKKLQFVSLHKNLFTRNSIKILSDAINSIEGIKASYPDLEKKESLKDNSFSFKNMPVSGIYSNEKKSPVPTKELPRDRLEEDLTSCAVRHKEDIENMSQEDIDKVMQNISNTLLNIKRSFEIK